MAQVALTGLAATAGPAAFSAEGNETGGDERAVKLESLDAGGQEAGDQGVMFRNVHG